MDSESVILESVENTMIGVLGRLVWESFFSYLESYEDITKEEIPNRLGDVFSVLEKCFGTKAGRTLGRVIVRRLYVKLALEFIEKPNVSLLEYSEEAIKELEKK